MKPPSAAWWILTSAVGVGHEHALYHIPVDPVPPEGLLVSEGRVAFQGAFWKTQEWPFCLCEGQRASGWVAETIAVSQKKEQGRHQEMAASQVLTSSGCQAQL